MGRDHMDTAKENIKTRFAESEKIENIQPYGANYEVGEFGYIQYYIFYEIVDWKDENDPSAQVVDPMKCIIFPTSPGCTNYLDPITCLNISTLPTMRFIQKSNLDKLP